MLYTNRSYASNIIIIMLYVNRSYASNIIIINELLFANSFFLRPYLRPEKAVF